MLRIVAIGMLLVSTGVCRAESPEIEQKLHGAWQGGPCVGRLEFRADGTFERRNYGPGNLRLRGTWKVTWDALPPKLSLHCTESDEPSFVGKPYEVKLLELTDEHLGLLSLAEKTNWPRGALDASAGEGVIRYGRPAK